MQQDEYSNKILTLKQAHRLMEQSRFQNKSTYYNNLVVFFTKASIISNNSLEREISSINLLFIQIRNYNSISHHSQNSIQNRTKT